MRCNIYFLAIIYFAIYGCASGPVTYEEIDQAVFDTREAYVAYDHDAKNEQTLLQVAKAMDRAQKKRDAFELNVKKAEIFYAHRDMCISQSLLMNGIWFCSTGAMQKEGQNELLHQYIRRYKRDKSSGCGCVDSHAAMDAVARALR